MNNDPEGSLIVGIAQLSGRQIGAAILANQPTPYNPDHLRLCRAWQSAATKASIALQLRDLYARYGDNIVLLDGER